MQNEPVRKTRRKTIRTKLLVIPIALVVLSIIAIIASVTYETYTSMRLQMREDNEFLLENVVSRLNDNDNSIISIEGLIDGRLLEALEAAQDRNIGNSPGSELTNDEIIDLANVLQVDELNLFDAKGEVIQSSFPENVGYIVDAEHPVSTLLASGESVIIEDDSREDVSGVLEGFYKYGVIKNTDGTVFQLGVKSDELIAMTDQFRIEVIIDDLMAANDVSYAGFVDTDYISTVNSNDAYLGMDMSDMP